MALDLGGSSRVECAAIAISAMALALSGSPRTRHLPSAHSRSSGETSSMAAATIRARSRTLRATMAAAAPDTGVDREP